MREPCEKCHARVSRGRGAGRRRRPGRGGARVGQEAEPHRARRGLPVRRLPRDADARPRRAERLRRVDLVRRPAGRRTLLQGLSPRRLARRRVPRVARRGRAGAPGAVRRRQPGHPGHDALPAGHRRRARDAAEAAGRRRGLRAAAAPALRRHLRRAEEGVQGVGAEAAPRDPGPPQRLRPEPPEQGRLRGADQLHDQGPARGVLRELPDVRVGLPPRAGRRRAPREALGHGRGRGPLRGSGLRGAPARARARRARPAGAVRPPPRSRARDEEGLAPEPGVGAAAPRGHRRLL
mmetsp:Transcript_25831/g.88319  ORF Transcript_25831/g.88319 Transcript_25831/m.88319 type:complete len:293 (+) Transcript_25831:284-1162(+)